MDISSHLVYGLVHASGRGGGASAVKAFEKAVAASDRPMPSKTLQPIETPTEDLISTRRVFETNGRTPQSAPIPIRPSITEYTSGELQALLRWVQSDGKLRTHDEITDEMFVALPFNRRGARIEVALRKAIQVWERTKNG
jgi:hypothetical protein